MSKRWQRYAVALSTVAAMTVGGHAVALADPIQFPDGQSVNPDDGQSGTDYHDNSQDHISVDEQRRAIERYMNSRDKQEQQIARQRLINMGIDPDKLGQQQQQNPAAPAANAPDNGGQPAAADQPAAAGSVNDPVPGAGKKAQVGGTIPANAGAGAPNQIAWKAVAAAIWLQTDYGKQIPYNMTGDAVDPERGYLDCSGFTSYVYNKAGLRIPGLAQVEMYESTDPKPLPKLKDHGSQPDQGKKVFKVAKREDVLPGDLAIWADGGGGNAHVVMFITKGGEWIQESGDPNTIGKFGDRDKSDGRTFQGYWRPTLTADGKPLTP